MKTCQQKRHRFPKMPSPRLAVSAGALAALSLAANRAAAQSLQVFTQWNFDQIAPAVNNSPAPTFGTGIATALGMTNNYVLADGSHNSVNTDDITNGNPLDALQATGPGVTYAWRVRGQPPSGATGKPADNGWSTAADQYTQGVEFDTDTTGRSGIVFSTDWFSTTAGIHDLQEQYTVNGTDWINVNGLQTNVPGGWVYGLKIDFGALGINDVNNDPNFGVRLVSAYDPVLGTYSGGDGSSVYNNLSGNWRFANVSFLSSSTNTTAGGPPSLTWSPPANVWNGANLNWKDSNGATVSFGGTSSVALFTDAAISSATAIATVNIASSGVAAASINVSNTNGTYLFTGGPISGGAFTKTGAGNVVLQGSNTFSGLNLLGGTLHTASDTNLGSAGARVLINGGALVADAALTLSHSISVGSNGGTLDGGTFALTNAGSLALSGPLVKTGSGNLTFTGGVTTNPGGTLAVTGGNVIFSATSGAAAVIASPTTPNTFAGNIVIANNKGVEFVGGNVDGPGSIQIQQSGASFSANSVGGTTLTTVNMPIHLNSLNASGPFITAIGCGGVGDVMILNAGAVISGTSDVILASGNNGGKGTLVLASQSTYTGNTFINNDSQGLTRLGIDNPLPVGTNLSFGDGSNAANIGALDLNGHDLTVGSIGTNLPGGTNQIAQFANGIANTASTTRMSTLTISGTATTTLNATIGTPTGVIINGGIPANNIAITLGASNTGTLILQGTNTYTGVTTVNGGTLQLDPAINTIGTATQSSLPSGNNVVNNASLIVNSPATFVGALSGSGATTINGTSLSYIQTLITPVLTVNTINQGAMVNNGNVTVQTSGNVTGPVSGAGTLTLATGANLAVGSLAQSTVNISDQAKLTFTQSATVAQFTNTATMLSLTGSATIDLNNHSLRTNVPAASIRQYLINGYANGDWNGTGGIASTWAANDATKSKGLGYAAQADGSTLITATLYGDTTLKGSVGLSDYNTLASNFNKPGVWAQGDFNYDGTVGLTDYNLLAANFNKSAQPGGGAAAAGASAPAAAKLTSGSASPAGQSVLPANVVDPGAGNVALEADPTTGKIYIVGHDSNINSYEVDSAAGKLTFVSQKNSGGYNTLTAQTAVNSLPGSNNPSEDSWAIISSGAGTFVAEAYPASDIPAFDIIGPGLQVFDLNKSGLAAWAAGTPISDLTFKYGNGTGATLTPAVISLGVPEPTCLALAGIGAGGLLGRRKRRVV